MAAQRDAPGRRFACGFPIGSMRCAPVAPALRARQFRMIGICAIRRACRRHRCKRPATGPVDDEGARKICVFCEHSGRIGCLPLRKRPLECAGFARDPPKVVDQVRFLARALFQSVPRECVGRTAVFEAARPGPIPGRGTCVASCPRGVTDSHTTLRRSWTRFNSWRGHSCFLTLEPDGQATGCNPVQVGSTPTGVFAIVR